MRPINLKISAFGPYAEEVKIEFDKFLDKGIYLISGNTGSGKSTIFEAIKFVLYGEDNGEIRSKYASDEVPTYVEMTFLLHGKEYKVTRNPKYLRPKSRGEGCTVAKAEAELIYPDGRVVSGYANVTKEIITLTGLNGEQFSKIVMIAQGKFRELLVADTANRSKIFRDIFKTEPYDKMQRKVKGRYLDACKENAKTNASIKQFVQGIRFDQDYEGKIRLENILRQEIITDIDEVLELTRDIIAKDEETYEANNDSLLVKNIGIQKEGNKLVEDKTLLENVEALQRELVKLQKYENDFEKVNEDYQRENGLKSKRDKLLIEIENEKKIVEKYKIFEDLSKGLSEIKKKALVLDSDLEKLVEDMQKLQEKVAISEGKIQEKLELEKELMTLDAALRDNEEYTRKLLKVKQCHEKLNNAVEKYEEKLQDFKKKEAACAVVRDKYNHAFTMFIEAQAGVMAKELEGNPDMPCPVCGSTNHVKLAKLVDGAPSEDEVDNMKNDLDIATSDVMKASNDAGVAKTSKENEINNLLDVIKEVDNTWTFDNYYENVCNVLPQVEDKASELKSSKKAIDTKLSLLCKDIEEIPKIKDRHVKIQELVKVKENEINNNKLEEKQLETNLDNVKEELKCDNESEAVESLNKKQETYNVMLKNYDLAVETYNKLLVDKKQSQTIVWQLSKQLKFRENEEIKNEEMEIEKITDSELELLKNNLLCDIETTEEKLSVLNSQREQIISYNNEVYSRIQNNKQIVKAVEQQKVNLSKITSRLSGLKALSDTLNGEVEGKDKIKLETFVQISYFEQVILKANTKLFEMTEGQYEFIRDISSEDKRTKSGLELSVYDHYNGTVRSVKTLSGGEGFMASLALALGMADIIEETASGISIDTMFIDEGFGSLDEDALEQAMKVLGKLSEGNKLVGIISHVSSLKDRIERQINVEKHMSGGSSVKVVM